MKKSIPYKKYPVMTTKASLLEANAQHLERIANLIDKGVDGTGRQPLTVSDNRVIDLIEDIDWLWLAKKLRQLNRSTPETFP